MRNTLTLPIFLLVLAFFTACSKSADHRQSLRDTNEANSAAQMEDLKPAEADYEGIIRMTKSHKTYKIRLSLKRVYENMRVGQGSDPTGTINVPKLSGVFTFHVLDNLDIGKYGKYAEITDGLGGFANGMVDFGDYDPNTNLMVLPYPVSGYNNGSFGELSGQLKDGLFTGTWFAKPLGVLGTFMLQQVARGEKQ